MQKSVKKGRIRNHLANNKTNKKNLHHQWASQTPFLPLLVFEPLAFAAKLYRQHRILIANSYTHTLNITKSTIDYINFFIFPHSTLLLVSQYTLLALRYTTTANSRLATTGKKTLKKIPTKMQGLII